MKNIFPIFCLGILIFCGCSNNKNPRTAESPVAADTTPRADSNEPPARHKHNFAVNIFPTVDVSPMDMAYYPVEYYKMNMANQTTSPLVVRVIYSRPHLNGRKLFQDVLKYGEPWRLGANEATEIQLFREVIIQGKKIKPGRYVLYCIPDEKDWTIVFNSNLDTWGLHPDTSKDIFRFEASVKNIDHHVEYFTMIFDKSDKGANLLIGWDNYEINLPLEFSIE